MNKAEKQQLKRALSLLNDEPENYHAAMKILYGLLGITIPDINIPPVDIRSYLASLFKPKREGRNTEDK